MKAVNIPQETMVQYALNFSADLEPFVHENTFVFIPEEVYSVSAIFVMVLFIGLTIAFWIVIYILKKELSSLLNSDIQRTLVIAVISQFMVIQFFQLIPFFFFFASLEFRIPNSGAIAEVAEILVI
ncbi:hypothetical protein FO519_008244, partial [Halicephalobus sp. NKZ332]